MPTKCRGQPSRFAPKKTPSPPKDDPPPPPPPPSATNAGPAGLFSVRGVQKFTRSPILLHLSRIEYIRHGAAREVSLADAVFVLLLIYCNHGPAAMCVMDPPNHGRFHQDEAPARPLCVPGRSLVFRALAPHRYWTPLPAALPRITFSGVTFAHP